MKINLQLGNSLSQAGKVPMSAKRMLKDPFADDHSGRWIFWVALALLVLAVAAWRLGWVNSVLPAGWQASTSTAATATAVVAAAAR